MLQGRRSNHTNRAGVGYAAAAPALRLSRVWISRRGLLAGGLLLVGGAGLALYPSALSLAPRRPLAVLDRTRFATLAAAASSLVTAPGADPIELAHAVDAWLETTPPEVQKDLGDLLALLESPLAGLLLDGRPVPFTRLDPAGREAALSAWRASRIELRRAGYTVLRKLTQRAHYMSPSTWASVGYPGPPEIASDP